MTKLNKAKVMNKLREYIASELSNTKTLSTKGNTMKKIKHEDRKLDITVKQLEDLLNQTIKNTEKQMIAKLKKAFLVK